MLLVLLTSCVMDREKNYEKWCYIFLFLGIMGTLAVYLKEVIDLRGNFDRIATLTFRSKFLFVNIWIICPTFYLLSKSGKLFSLGAINLQFFYWKTQIFRVAIEKKNIYQTEAHELLLNYRAMFNFIDYNSMIWLLLYEDTKLNGF